MNFHYIEIDLPFIFGGLESYLLVELIQKYKYYEKENQLISINDKNCFFYTYESIQQRLPFSRCQLDTIIKNLKMKNVIEVFKKGLPARNYFCLNFGILNSLRETYKLECNNPTLYKVDILQTTKQESLNVIVENSQTIMQETDNDINNYLLLNNNENNIDIVDEKILFSQSVYFERFSLFEKDMKKFFTKKNIDFDYYYKTICEGKKTQSEKFTNEEWKEFFINGINFLIEKYGLVKIEKEKIILHSFENSVYFENLELFKNDFEEKYPNIDYKFYHEKYSNQAIAKGYKNADWKRTFQNWLNDLKGNYQKIEIKPEIKQTPLVRKMSLSDEKHERIHEILQGENPKEILEANYGINSVLYLSQMIDYIFPKNNYNVTEIWNRK